MFVSRLNTIAGPTTEHPDMCSHKEILIFDSFLTLSSFTQALALSLGMYLSTWEDLMIYLKFV